MLNKLLLCAASLKEKVYTIGDEVASFTVKIGQHNFTDSATGEVSTYLGYSTNLGIGGSINGVGQYTYGSLVDESNIDIAGFSFLAEDNTVCVAIRDPYNDNLFSNKYIAVEINGSVYLKTLSTLQKLGEVGFYVCPFHEGNILSLTNGETIIVRVFSVLVS